MERYNLFIRSYKKNIGFNTRAELREELLRWLSPREVKLGILDQLTTFNEDRRKEDEDGFIENHYGDLTTCDFGE